jgi:hypothetical protein
MSQNENKQDGATPAPITPDELIRQVPDDVLALLIYGWRDDSCIDGGEYEDYACAIGQVLGALRGIKNYTTRYDAEPQLHALNAISAFVRRKIPDDDRLHLGEIETVVKKLSVEKGWPDWAKLKLKPKAKK